MAQSVGYVFPASFSQERLWFLDQLEADGSVFNMPAAVHLVGPLDVAALGGALNEVVRRHEALRTTFRYSDEQLVQVVAPVLVVEVPVVEVGGAGGRERWAQALRLVERQAVQPFDLASGPLLRAVLLRLGQDEHVLVVVLHHIVADGFSMGVLVGELSAAYAALVRGEPVSLEPLAVQYADVAVWQRRQLQGARLEGELSYWRGQLRDAPVLQLATDRPRPAVQSYRGASQQVRWPDGLRQQLEALGRRHGASLFMVLLAGFEALLSRYSGQDDIVVGSFIANRTRPEVERLIGFFVNTLALRGDLSGDPSFAELLGRVRECCLGAYAHQQVPFEKLLVELQPERDLSRTPLFQAMLVLQSHAVPALQLPGVACRVLPVATRRANVDLTVWVTPEPDGLAVVGEYASDLFEPATVTRLLGHLRVLLEAAAADPALRLSELPLLGAAEREQVLVGFNQPTRPAGSTVGGCLQELFAAQAARTPDVPALLDGTQRLTYRQLQQRANQLAHALRGLGVGPEVLVGVCLDRSVEAVVAVLGVLKAGGAWLPLDPAHPPARLGFVLADAGVRVLVSRQQLLDRLPGQALEGVPVVCLDSDYHQIAAQPDHDPAVNTSPDQLAYVIYTSGSTGKPKGVMIEHAAVVNYLSYAGEEFALQPGDRVLQFHSLTVDTSVEEIFPCLARGATLVIRPESMIDSATAFVRGCSDLGITVLDLPTGYWHELTVGFAREGVTLPACVRLLIIAGEKALPDRLLRWQEHVGERVRLVNTYGPTETAIVATICDLPGAGGIPDGTRELPIGRPVPNLQAYVLDRHLSPVPVGVPGELHVGGVGLARGYLNRPQLTAERFVANPFSDDPPARLYKTGDLARHLPDGSLEFVGRLDHQVKLRGFRIEPGEIEAVLARHPAVQDAMVVTRDRTPTERQLVAYLVTEPDARMPAVPELRAFLGEQLPGHMIPSVFTTLERLPRTPAGKVDRAALPAPDHARPDLGRERVAPRNPVEGQLAGIWSELLGVEQIGVDDDFFELGGHSMLGVQLLFRIRKTFDVELPLFTVFQTPTVAGLAEIVARRVSERRGGRLLDAEEVLARLDELSQEEVDSLLRELSAEQGEVSR